ncbi:LOB domain-containing protein 41-like [Juglans microcarpa x Juglans regia]|uniref:LOB domain-containing protein 41-like n=1 Tax=Juglans microcarpa x Juglans regia TaxID=2249226 RepID=UPI001B7DFC03|nr:LOB domain-containing protein 41-like [Juglans microcarpa x Juglans regia]
MRMSCNGCRVLRKGCSENCSIRPCLMWIKSPESQANATVFLAKFYGRAGLMNLINAGPEHLRPAIFRSLLYEACGRIVNPIYGSVGLLWSGSWQLCQSAVEAVLKGAPITAITSEAAASDHGPPLKAYDIRHVSKDENSAASNDPHRVKTRCRFKRSVIKPRASKVGLGAADDSCLDVKPKWDGGCCTQELNRSTSHESSLSHQSELAANVEGESKETESMISVETAETSVLFLSEPKSGPKANEQGQDSEIGLELTLGFEPVWRANHVVPVKKRKVEACVGGSSTGFGTCKMELGLDYPV